MNDGTEQLQWQSQWVRTSLKGEFDFGRTTLEQAVNPQKEGAGRQFQM